VDADRAWGAVRPARVDDLPAIVALLAEDDLGALRETATDPLPASYHTAFAQIDRDPAHLLVVAESDERVVGTLHLTFLRYLTYTGGLRAHIEAVRVAQDARGSGLGRVLVGWAIEEARRRDAHVVQLTTDARRDGAQRFYESLGFRPSHVGMKLHLDGA
jgi:GNAT superfamily N-acetyltransferase